MENIHAVKNLHFMLQEHVCIGIYSRNLVEDNLLNIPVIKVNLYHLQFLTFRALKFCKCLTI